MTEFDNTQAYTEGWLIADCDGSDNGRWQLQKIDDDNVFPDDGDAWRFVNERALAGSAYHQSALDWLAENCQQEFECIQRATRTVEG